MHSARHLDPHLRVSISSPRSMATTLSPGADVPIRSQSVRTTRRPPTNSRAEQPLPRSESSSRAESSRPHRRSSQRSTSGASPRHHQPADMPSSAPNNAGPSEDARETSDSRGGQRTAKHRYRTVIPAPSGNYAFIKTIGQGSMGKVKLAKREGTNELASSSTSSHPVLTPRNP